MQVILIDELQALKNLDAFQKLTMQKLSFSRENLFEFYFISVLSERYGFAPKMVYYILFSFSAHLLLIIRKFLNFYGLYTKLITSQPHKMVKHTQTISGQTADELFECVWSCCGVGA